MREQTDLVHTFTYVGREWNPITQRGNFDKSRLNIDVIVLHSMDGTLEGTTAWFKNPSVVPSAHYGIGYNGEIVQWLPENVTAYHAGLYSVNQRSIGIEHEDKKNNMAVRPDSLYESSAKLVANICVAYSIPANRTHIKLHKEIKATLCPGNLDVDRIIRRAKELMAPAPPPAPPEQEIPHMLKPSVFANLVSRSTEYEELFRKMGLDLSFAPRPGSHDMVLNYIVNRIAEVRIAPPPPDTPTTPATVQVQPSSMWKADVREVIKEILGIIKTVKTN